MTDFFRNKNILITGANGFTGTWLSVYLTMMGACVYGFGKKDCHTNKFYSASNSEIFYDFDILNINNSSKLREKYTEIKFDFIFHLAAQPLVLNAYIQPGSTMRTNVTGTINLIDFIIETQPMSKNLFVTTDKVYFNSNTGSAFSERDRLWGNEPYASSKVAMEAVIEGYFQSDQAFKNRSVIARAGNIFGGGDFSQNRLIVDYFSAKNSSKQLLIRQPNAIRPWQHIIEVIDAYCKLIINDKSNGSAFNIGPDEDNCISVIDLLLLFNKYDSDPVEILYDTSLKKYESKYLSLDNKKIKNKNIWSPSISLEQAIDITCYWYENYQTIGGIRIIKDQLKELLCD